MDGVQLRDEAAQDRDLASDPQDSYRADIVLMLNRGLRRLIVSIDELRAHNRELADGALKDVIKTIPNRPSRETADEVIWGLTNA
ncbi:hypothetical protein APSETT444_001326 [Aspergillus pseudonomiae]